TALKKGYYHKDQYHELMESVKFEADSITLRGAEVPDELFTLSIPPGAELMDQDMNNLRVKDPVEVERHIDAAVASVERQIQGGWLKWIYFAGSVLFLGAFIYVLVRLVWGRKTGKARSAG